MNDFVFGDIFDSQADVIVVPFDSKGSVATSFFQGLKKFNAPISLSDQIHSPGDIYVYTVDSRTVKYILYACTVDDFKSSYTIIRTIARKLGRHMMTFRRITSGRVGRIACPILGSRSGNLDPTACHNILQNGFYEIADNTIQFDVYTIGPYTDNIFLDPDKPSSRIALEAMIPEVTENPLIRQLMHDEEFYYELAESCFRGFMELMKDEPNDFFLSTAADYENSGLSFANYLSRLEGQSSMHRQYQYLTRCAEFITYLDYHAYGKNYWNQTPDKRVLARSAVRQNNWVVNLTRYKVMADMREISAPSVRNTIMYLLNPEYSLTMLSEEHRRMLCRNLLNIHYRGAEDLSYVLRYFESLGLVCNNPRNYGAMVSRILYLPEIKPLWFDEKKLHKGQSDDIVLESDTSFAAKLIIENYRTKEKRLDLGRCGITDLGLFPELFDCTHLEILILSNEWGEYENGAWRKKKSENSGSPNHLNYLPNQLEALSNLEVLIIGGGWNEDKQEAKGWNISNISPLKKLLNLRRLNASNNTIKNIKAIKNLIKLEYVYLNNNEISSVPSLKLHLKLKEINLSNNRIHHVGSFTGLAGIRTIDLHANKIRDIRPLIPQIERIGIKAAKWAVDTISIANNPLEFPPMQIIEIGTEEVLRYFQNIQESGFYINNEVKVIMVGNSEVGKTTMAKYLDGEKALEDPHAYTNWMKERVFLSKYKLGALGNKQCQIRLFDFGGHDYFHDTHHLFFDTNTIYILLWDEATNRMGRRDMIQENTLGEKVKMETFDYPVSYWLESVQHFIKDETPENFDIEIERGATYKSSVVVIQNKVGNNQQIRHLDNEELFNRFPFIYDFLNLSLKNPRRLMDHFDTIITEMLNSQQIVGARLPLFYKAVKDGITRYSGKPILSMQEFFAYCNGLPSIAITIEQCRSVALYLKRIGVILWYPKNGDSDRIYVDKDWIVKEIYKILEGIPNLKGEFDMAHVVKATQQTDQSLIDQILSIMIEFRIIVRHPYDLNRFIAPLYLPTMPEQAVHLFVSNKAKPYRRFEYRGFIQKHVVLSFFEKYSKLITGEVSGTQRGPYYYWKDALILKDIDSQEIVLIKFHQGNDEGNACIDVVPLTEASGHTLIDKVVSYIKELNDGYVVEEMVTLNGIDYVSIDILNENAKNGKLVFSEQRMTDKTKKKTKPHYFKLQDFKSFIMEAIKKKKVVISYSKKDLLRVHTFMRYLKPLEDRGLIEKPWYCTAMHPADIWEAQIQQHFEAADIVFFMVSEYFYSTDYIVEKEIKNVLRRYKNNQSVKVVPIILEHYDWVRPGEWDLAVFSALPYQAKPISDFKNEKIAWNTITESVRMMIEKDLDPGKDDTISRTLQEIYERQVAGKLDNNS